MNARSVSSKTLWLVWLALLVLLALTWLVSRLQLGLGNTIAAIVIAGVKMLLVILFFMQVRYNSRLVWIFACAGFVWWMIFISLAMTDYLTRHPVAPYQRSDLQLQKGAIVRIATSPTSANCLGIPLKRYL